MIGWNRKSIKVLISRSFNLGLSIEVLPKVLGLEFLVPNLYGPYLKTMVF